jgi:RNA polymerase sigma factor (sigma-70 family)
MQTLLNTVHILDADPSRRAAIAFGLTQRNISTQIYENVEEFLNWGPREGLLLLNEDAAGESVSEINCHLSACGAFVPLAMYSDNPTTMQIVRAMLAGAIDYLEWPFDAARLEQTATKIEGEALVRLRERQKRSEAVAAVSALTEREREVLRAMVEGCGNKQIAKMLEISPRTVEVHRANLLGKLNAQSSSEAIRLGIYAGLDQPG